MYISTKRSLTLAVQDNKNIVSTIGSECVKYQSDLKKFQIQMM
jgi:hypothetical protein